MMRYQPGEVMQASGASIPCVFDTVKNTYFKCASVTARDKRLARINSCPDHGGPCDPGHFGHCRHCGYKIEE